MYVKLNLDGPLNTIFPSELFIGWFDVDVRGTQHRQQQQQYQHVGGGGYRWMVCVCVRARIYVCAILSNASNTESN